MLKTIERLYDVASVDTLPDSIIIDDVISFLKNVQSYEWAMCQAKSEDAGNLLACAINKEKNKASLFTKGTELLGTALKLAYLDSEIDSSRPMLNKYHKNTIRLFNDGKSLRMYLNGILFLSIDDKENFALLNLVSDKDGNLYWQKVKAENLFAYRDELPKALAKETLLALVNDHAYFDERIHLPSYHAYVALDQMKALSQLSLNKRYRYLHGLADSPLDSLILMVNSLTKEVDARVWTDSAIVLAEDAELVDFEELLKNFSDTSRRFMRAETNRDLQIAMSRGIEVLSFSPDLLESFLMFLPSWRNKKVSYLVSEDLLSKERADYLWKRLENRTEKERSLAIYLGENASQTTAVFED